jgi:phosphopantetheinyl transferase
VNAGWVVLHYADIAASAERDDEFAAWLSERERARSRRFSRPDRAARYIRAHGLLREILAREVGTRPESLRFERRPGGRPELADGCGTRFSLSHCIDRALIAVTVDVPVGADVERARTMSGRLISKIVPPWCALPDDAAQLQRRALELWTCTEAALKCCGRGIGALDALTLLPHPDEGVCAFRFRGAEEVEGVAVTLALDPAHVGSIAVPGRDVPAYRLA